MADNHHPGHVIQADTPHMCEAWGRLSLPKGSDVESLRPNSDRILFPPKVQDSQCAGKRWPWTHCTLPTRKVGARSTTTRSKTLQNLVLDGLIGCGREDQVVIKEIGDGSIPRQANNHDCGLLRCRVCPLEVDPLSLRSKGRST